MRKRIDKELLKRLEREMRCNLEVIEYTEADLCDEAAALRSKIFSG